MATSRPRRKKTAENGEEEVQLEAVLLTMSEETKFEELTRRNKCLEDKISKIRIVVNDQEDVPAEVVGQEAELQTQLKVLRTENEQLREDHAKCMTELQENLQDITSLSRAQQTTLNCLKDELSATRQMAAETQLRQLNELETLTEETRELKQTLITTLIQQQQPTTTDEHQSGVYTSSCGAYSFCLLLRFTVYSKDIIIHLSCK